MQIEFVSAVPTAAPVDATGASPEEATGTESFADLLSAAGEESSESAPVEETSDESSVDEWAIVPVFVPVIPVVPPQDVIEVRLQDAANVDTVEAEDLSIEAVNQVSVATPIVGPLAGAGKSIDTNPAPVDATAIDAAAPSVFEPSAAAESVETETVTAATPALPAEPATEAEDIVAAPSKAPDTGKPAKQTSAVHSTADIPDVSNAAQGTTTRSVASADVQNTSTDGGNSMPRSATTDTPIEPTSGHKGAAARLARALERAAEATAPHHVETASGNGSQSFDGADQQSSLGDWLREQLPQAAHAGARSASAGTFNFVAPPAQHDVRVAGVIGSPETSPMPGGPVLPREHDVTMQLVQSLRLQFRDGIGEAVLKLKPEHLGSVAISLRVENGGLKANVQADLPAVRQWLESQQEMLRTALAEHGLRLDRFEVEADGHRQAPPEEQQERSPRKRQTRRSSQSDQPVFEVVV